MIQEAYISDVVCNIPAEADFTLANRETSFGGGTVPSTVTYLTTYTHFCKSSFTVLGAPENDNITVECRELTNWNTSRRTGYLSTSEIPTCVGRCIQGLVA